MEHVERELLTETKFLVKQLSFDTMGSLLSQFGYDLREISKLQFMAENTQMYQMSLIT